jgi:hypothetical protein
MEVKIELKESIDVPPGEQKTTFKATNIINANDLKEFMTSVYKEIWPSRGKK